MKRSRARVSWLTASCLGLLVAGVGQAADFAAPPQAEREAVAAIAGKGGRSNVDGDYRLTGVMLSANCTNDEVKRLAGCERLTTLQISSEQITDAALDDLKKLTQLTSLTVARSGLSEQSLEALRTALPNCRISALGFRGGTTFGTGRGGFAAGPPGGFGGRGGPGVSRPTSLARSPEVQDDLKLTAEQRQQITAASDLNELLRAADEKIAAVLSPEQRTRLKQIELQQTLPSSLLREDVAKELKISADQQAAIRKLNDAATEEQRAALADLFRQRGQGGEGAPATTNPRDILAKITRERDEKIVAALSDEQRKAWEVLAGPAGPRVTTEFGGFTGGGFGAPREPAEIARSVFDRYDADRDGKLTDTEFASISSRTSQNMTAAGITLEFPASREDFEKAYIKYLERPRDRNAPRP